MNVGNMRQWASVVAALAVLGGGAGCGLLEQLNPNRITVRLINDGDFEVRGELYYDEDQNTPRAALTEFGTRIEFAIAAGETRTITRDCDDLQALVIDRAELRVVGGVGPEADTDVLRDGDDFGCGDTIELRFDHEDIPTQLDIEISITE